MSKSWFNLVPIFVSDVVLLLIVRLKKMLAFLIFAWLSQRKCFVENRTIFYLQWKHARPTSESAETDVSILVLRLEHSDLTNNLCLFS